MSSIVLIRGGGDLASGIALRLARAGLHLVITELPQPLAVRRTVSFAEAVYAGEITLEGMPACRVEDPTDLVRIQRLLERGCLPVLVDPGCTSASSLQPVVIVDACMTKRPPQTLNYTPGLYIGIGPGFEAGLNCQAVVETQRGHALGRVYWQGCPAEDNGSPQGDKRRVLRAPTAGKLVAHHQIGDHCETDDLLAEIVPPIGTPVPIQSPFPGILRGLLHPGLDVVSGMKIGDLDPRDDPRLCTLVSDKALAIGGGTLEALLTRPEIRRQLWSAGSD